jgi:EAL domain-containing protein (putative c-di-GMP-specific phosphodiesterase class I)
VISGCDERIMNATVRMAYDAGIPNVSSLSKPINLMQLRDILNAAKPGRGRRSREDQKTQTVSVARLERALRDREIHAAFQPKIELSSGRIVGSEALARWTCSDLGAVPPETFIAAAERSHQIKALTLLMLEEAIEASRDFIARDPAFVMAVNISGSLVSDRSLPEEIERILQHADVRPSSLLLEVTETTAMADASRAIDVLLQLRLRGIGLSIDDFGTGYSSLSALARMPFNELKIDRSFVTHCRDDDDMWKIVRGSIALAHGFGMKVVAEGIEDMKTAEALSAIGCDLGQGYVFAPAFSRARFRDFYDDRHFTGVAPIVYPQRAGILVG